MQRSNANVSFDIPVEYCGQGVSVESAVRIESNGKAYVRTIIKDGTNSQIGTFELSDERKKVYLDLREVDKMKRRTLVNVIAKLKETLECALSDQLTAESDGTPAAEEEETSASEEEETPGGEAEPVSEE